MSQVIKTVTYRSGHYDEWAVEAKAAGYPLCTQCREPIDKGWWNKQPQWCSRCRRAADPVWVEAPAPTADEY